MSEFTMQERVVKVVVAVAYAAVWWVLFAAFALPALFTRPIGSLTLWEIVMAVAPLIALPAFGYWVISLLYEAFSGRDSVWFWHPR